MKKEEFENFGDVIEVEGEKMRIIKKGKNERYNDMERVEEEGKKKREIINIFRGKYFEEKIDIMMMERNKLGQKDLIKMKGRKFMVVVEEDEGDGKERKRDFIERGDKGVNYMRNIWNKKIIEMEKKQDFMVVEREGREDNMEEYFL